MRIVKASSWMITLWSILALISIDGCKGRDPSNPFDPNNPETDGHPYGLTAMAGWQRVDLSWSDIEMDDLTGITIKRSADGSPLSTLTDPPLPPTQLTFSDSSASSGVEYLYKLEYHFTDSSVESLRTVAAEPGGACPWVADPCGWGINLLTPDGRHVSQSSLSTHPVLDLDIDPVNHRVFAAQINAGLVVILGSQNGDLIDEIPVLGASCVSWQGEYEAMAVGAYYEQQVSWLTDEGTLLKEMEFNGYPEDIAFRDSSTTWVALRDGGVHRVAFANGDVDSVRAEIGRAVSIADDPGHGCWVADREGGVVLYISDDLSSVSSLPGLLVKPIDLEFIGDGLCWVVDNAEQKLILLNRQCESIEIREDMGAVSGVAYDPNTESLWVTRSSDGEVDRYRSDGSTTTISLPGCPRIIEGDWLGLVR